MESKRRANGNAGGRTERARDARFRVVANASIVPAVAAERLVIPVPLVFDEVVAAPEKHVRRPARPLRGGPAEKSGAVPASLRLLSIRHVPRGQRVEFDRCGVEAVHGGRDPDAGRCRHTVGDRAGRELLAPFVNDVELKGQRERTRHRDVTGDPRVQPLAVLRSVEPLPGKPCVVSNAGPAQSPLEPCLVRPLERQSLPLKGRQQPVRPRAADRVRHRPIVYGQGPEAEGGSASSHGQRRDRSDKLERVGRAEALVPEDSQRDIDAVVHVHRRGQPAGRAEYRFPLAKRVAELRVVAVKQ